MDAIKTLSWIRCIIFSMCWCLFSHQAFSQPLSWQVRPAACIVEFTNDYCEIDLNITYEQLPAGDYCYFQDDIQLFCWQSSQPMNPITLRFNQSTVLTLRDDDNQILLTQKIDVKARVKKAQTRRVRQPWSLF